MTREQVDALDKLVIKVSSGRFKPNIPNGYTVIVVGENHIS